MGGDRLEDLTDGLLWDACRSLDRVDDIALLLAEYAPPTATGSPSPCADLVPPACCHLPQIFRYVSR